MMMSPKPALFLCVIAAFCISASVEAVHTFSAHRLLQYDISGEPFGSRRTSLDNAGSSSSVDASDFARKLVVVPLEEVSEDLFDDLLSNTRTGGILVVLPRDLHNVSPTTLNKWMSYERHLLSKEIAVPIYFAFADDDMNDVVSDLEASTGKDSSLFFGDGRQFVVSASEGAPTAVPKSANYQGWFDGLPSTSGGDAATLPTFAIVAGYNAYAAAPSLATGASSGTVGVLELARIFSRLYSSSRTRPSYNLVFVLTGAATLNFAGARHWLESIESRLLESIEFVLCLDDLNGDLKLHYSKPPKEETIEKLYNEFDVTAKRMNLDFGMVHKKINISQSFIPWEHEQFSRKRVIAATLSSRDAPSNLFERGSVIDQVLPLDEDKIVRNIQFIAEVVAKHMFGHHQRDVTLLDGTHSVSRQFVGEWLKTLSETPRCVQESLSEDIASGFKAVFSEYTASSSEDWFKPETEMTFYGPFNQVEMSAYMVKPFFFDILLLASNLVYLGALYLLIRGPNKEELMSLFSSKKKSTKIH